ncbi:MAG: hypothetical protein JKX75_06315 [Gammaproteobacteria bacterium]|nr:hypothetical protein [Gammaproteobacteria bacterium]
MSTIQKTNTARNNARMLASYLLSFSLFAVAGAIVYFTYEVSVISKYIPSVLSQVDATTEKIIPIVDEVAVITALVPSILKEIEATRKMIPPILAEVEKTRKMIPPILKQVEQTRNQIPAVLKESKALRGDLPKILRSADKASAAVADVSKQVEATRPLVVDVLQEVEKTRESIPPMMDRADVLIDKAREAGKEASQGAVSGIFSGIIRAPFSLLADAGRGISGLSEKEAKNLSKRDFELVEQAALQLLNNGSVDDQRSWKNTESEHRGDLFLTDIYNDGEYAEIECRMLMFKLYKKDVLKNESDRSFCKTDEGTWDFDEE